MIAALIFMVPMPAASDGWLSLGADFKPAVYVQTKNIVKIGDDFAAQIQFVFEEGDTHGNYYIKQTMEGTCSARTLKTNARYFFGKDGQGLGFDHPDFPWFKPEPDSAFDRMIELACAAPEYKENK